jgi:hypothetical protein
MAINLPKNYSYTVTLELSSNSPSTSDLNEAEQLAMFEKIVSDWGMYRDNSLLKVTAVVKQ